MRIAKTPPDDERLETHNAKMNGIARAAAKAGSARNRCAYWSIRNVARHNEVFTSDEVEDFFIAHFPDLAPTSKRGWSFHGAQFLKLQRQGWIEQTGEQRLSTKKKRHHWQPVWRMVPSRRNGVE